MPAAKTAPPPKPISTPIALGALLLAGISVWAHVPAFVVLWAGLVAAAISTQPPMLTGKGPGNTPAPQGQEVHDLLEHRKWEARRSALLVPGPAWSPWPASTSVLAAIATAFIAYALPSDLTVARQYLESVPEMDTSYFPALNAIAAYVVVASMTHVGRAFASESEPAPPIGVGAVLAVVKQSPWWIVTFAALMAFAAAVGAFVPQLIARSPIGQHLPLDPAWAVGVGIGIAIAAGIVHALIGTAVRTDWRQRVEARELWASRFGAAPKAVDLPRLIEHKRLGEQGEVWLDTFDIPASMGGQKDLTNRIAEYLPYIGADTEAVFVSVPQELGGQVVPASKHPSRFQAINWPAGFHVDVSDPNVDPDILWAWLRAGFKRAATQAGVNDPLFVSAITPEHSTDPEKPSPTAAWRVSLASGDAGELLSTLWEWASPGIPARIFAETLLMDGDQLLLGTLEQPTVFADASMPGRISDERIAAEWKEAWSVTSAKHEAYPQVKFLTAKKLRMGMREATIERLPFAVPRGNPAATYLALNIAELATSLGGIPHVAMAYWPRPGGRPGDIADAFFQVLWCKDSVNLEPHIIAPQVEDRDRRGGRPDRARMPRRIPSQTDTAAGEAMRIVIYRAFSQAKLAQPYMVSLRPLSTLDSREHLWDVELRLFGTQTVADLRVRKAMDTLKAALGSPYLRISATGDSTVHLLTGADPRAGRVTFLGESEEALTMELDWEQAFGDSNLLIEGRAPRLKSLAPLPKNAKVTRFEFEMPPGMTVDRIRMVVEKLRATTRNLYIDIRAADTPDRVVILACPESPLPFPAPFDWEHLASTELVPFALGVEGEPIEYDPAEDPHMLLLGGTGSGKAQPLDAPIPVPVSERFPDGWARNGELHVGDAVLTPAGGTTRITSFSDVEVSPTYVVTLDDGQEVRASGHHLWRVSTRKTRHRGSGAHQAARDLASSERIAHAERLERIAASIAPGTAGSTVQIAALAGIEVGELYRADVIHPALAREVLQRTEKSAAVYDAAPVLAYAQRVGASRGAVSLGGVKVRADRIAELGIEGSWLSTRALTEAFLERESTRAERDSMKQLLSKLQPERRAGHERRLIRVYPVDETLVELARYHRRIADGAGFVRELVLTTEQLRERLLANPEVGLGIAIPEPLDGADADLPIDPYLLGAWLGDGTSAAGELTVGDADLAALVPLLEGARGSRASRIANYGSGWTVAFGATDEDERSLTTELRQLGILGDKRIPATYLRASRAQRLALLQGLMDTDGTIGAGCELTLTNARLAAGALELIRSLGIKASLRVGVSAYVRDGIRHDAKPRHRITFTTAQPVFRLPRKAERLPQSTRATTLQHYIVDIRVEEAVEQRCLRTESAEHLYLTAGFVTTHNSAATLAILSSVLHRGWDTFIIDVVKGAADFAVLDPWTAARATGALEAEVVALHIERELDRRVALNKQHGAPSFAQLPEDVRPGRWFLMVDEFTSMSLRLADKPLEPAPEMTQERQEDLREAAREYQALRTVLRVVGRVLREARSAGITMLFAGQTLTADVAKHTETSNATYKANTAKIALGKMQPAGYLSAFGETPDVDLGDNIPKGRGVFRDMTGRDRLIQSWYDGSATPDGAAENVRSVLDHLLEERGPRTLGVKLDLAAAIAEADASRPQAFGAVIEPRVTVQPIEALEAEAPSLDEALAQAVELDLDLGAMDFDLSGLDELEEHTSESESAAATDEPILDDDWVTAFLAAGDGAEEASELPDFSFEADFTDPAPGPFEGLFDDLVEPEPGVEEASAEGPSAEPAFAEPQEVEVDVEETVAEALNVFAADDFAGLFDAEPAPKAAPKRQPAPQPRLLDDNPFGAPTPRPAPAPATGLFD